MSDILEEKTESVAEQPAEKTAEQIAAEAKIAAYNAAVKAFAALRAAVKNGTIAPFLTGDKVVLFNADGTIKKELPGTLAASYSWLSVGPQSKFTAQRFASSYVETPLCVESEKTFIAVSYDSDTHRRFYCESLSTTRYIALKAIQNEADRLADEQFMNGLCAIDQVKEKDGKGKKPAADSKTFADLGDL